MEGSHSNDSCLIGRELEMSYDSDFPKKNRCSFFSLLRMTNKRKQDWGYSTCAMVLWSNMCPTPHFILTSRMLILARLGFQKGIGHEGRVIMNGVSVLKQEILQFICLFLRRHI